VSHLGPQLLQRHLAIELVIVGKPDAAHAAEGVNDLVGVTLPAGADRACTGREGALGPGPLVDGGAFHFDWVRGQRRHGLHERGHIRIAVELVRTGRGGRGMQQGGGHLPGAARGDDGVDALLVGAQDPAELDEHVAELEVAVLGPAAAGGGELPPVDEVLAQGDNAEQQIAVVDHPGLGDMCARVH
jgi:hypothetical protein